MLKALCCCPALLATPSPLLTQIPGSEGYLNASADGGASEGRWAAAGGDGEGLSHRTRLQVTYRHTAVGYLSPHDCR